MHPDLPYQIALTLVPHIGPVQAKILLQHFDVNEIFAVKRSTLEKIEGIGAVRANSIRSFKNFSLAEAELSFIDKFGITPLFITDKNYPQRLLNCYDSPTILYYKGEADLNASKTIAIIGTRKNTEYGKHLTEALIRDLAAHNILVISGLAYGIDGIAHRCALQHHLSTIGVLAHGLDLLYPSLHTGLAREMIRQNGGLLTEFRSGTNPDKHNFPTRNRIVAGLSDATIVVETDVSGGSMITAELANNYNRDVFAFPGRITDSKSTGCNRLIKTNRAVLLTGAEQILETMGWEQKKRVPARLQQQLFIELSAEEKIIVGILKDKESVHIDEIHLKSRLSSSAVAAAILNMELQGIIGSKPGKLYLLTC
jgi:DNA processing protein